METKYLSTQTLGEVPTFMWMLTILAITLKLYLIKNRAYYAIITLFHHSISKFGIPRYLITDRGTEFFKSEIANSWTLSSFRHSSRTSNAPWTKELIEIQKKILVPSFEWFYLILLKTGWCKLISLLIAITLNNCHNCIFHHMKYLSMHNRVFHGTFY